MKSAECSSGAQVWSCRDRELYVSKPMRRRVGSENKRGHGVSIEEIEAEALDFFLHCVAGRNDGSIFAMQNSFATTFSDIQGILPDQKTELLTL